MFFSVSAYLVDNYCIGGSFHFCAPREQFLCVVFKTWVYFPGPLTDTIDQDTILQNPVMANKAKIDLLNSSTADLQQLLEDREVTSSELVIQYLDQIEKHNHNGMKLRAVISVAPKDTLLQRAEELDRERQEKGSRGPMHGIPILVKVVSTSQIQTSKPAANSD